MPTVRDQDKDHPFYSRLAEFFDSRADGADTRARLWSPIKKCKPHSPKLKICQAIPAFAVRLTFDGLHIFAGHWTTPGQVIRLIL
jgi:hypothetical protein